MTAPDLLPVLAEALLSVIEVNASGLAHCELRRTDARSGTAVQLPRTLQAS